MNMKELIDSVSGHLYSHFILRDFAFLGSGTVFLFVVSHLLGAADQIFINTTNTLLFLGAAYFTGIFMQETCIFLKIFQMTPTKGPEGEEDDKNNWPLCMHQLYMHIHPAALVAIERTVYLKQVAATFGSAALFGIIFSLIHAVVIWWRLNACPSPLHYWTFGAGIALFLICKKENKIKMNLQYKSVSLLKSKYVPKNNNAS